MSRNPGFVVATLAVCLASHPSRAQEPPKKPAWDLHEVLAQLGHYPKDVYLQYVAMMLGRREGRDREVAERLERLMRAELMEERAGRRARADLFSTFTGALAVQESLQLDTMRGERPGGRRGRLGGAVPQAPVGIEPPKKEAPEPPPAKAGPVGQLTGPTVKSHPWEKMLGDKKPDVGPLATCVPEDFWFAEFRSVAAINEVTRLSEIWGRHLFTQVLGEGGSQATVERIKKQLGLFQLPPEVLEALKVEGVALAGSDLFVGEGSDVTILIQAKGGVGPLADIALRLRGKEEKGEHVGIAYGHYTSADGVLNAYVANPRPDLHVRGNSLPAFQKVLECVAGKGAKRLGESKEFQYVRTLMPYRAAEEDGYVYLSDPFIRRLVGAQLKLTERRRVLVYNHLRMIGHACLMFRTEHGRAPKSLEELAEAKCAAGVFGKGELAHPDGGTYSLAADGMSGVCSKWGRAEALTPCIEHLVTEATGEEAAEYKAFMDDYNQYWRTYFDPIAVRVRVAAKQYRLETLILPLIDNSIYATMARALGGPAAALDTLATPKREIGGLWVHFDKKALLELLGPEEKAEAKKEPEKGRTAKDLIVAQNQLKELLLAFHNYHDVTGHFPADVRDKDGKPLLSWRVQLLPYAEADQLYKQFKLDEPWDSEHNKKLIAQMPKVFQGPTAKLNSEGKTVYLGPAGKDTLFPPDGKELTFANVSDGLSNTIAVVEAADEAAVVWSKPGDLPIDPAQPWANLKRSGQDFTLIAMADGSTRRVSHQTDAAVLAGAFTRAGGEAAVLDRDGREPAPGPLGLDWVGLLELDRLEFDTNKLRRFLRDGIGDQVGFHLHDASRLLDYETSGALAGGGGPGPFGGEFGPAELFGLGAVVQFVSGPSSISIPVKDAKVVDDFLAHLDRVLVKLREGDPHNSFIPLAPEFYRLSAGDGPPVRCVAFKVSGLVYRVYWARIGDGLYIANRPFVLDDIRAAQSAGTKPVARDTGHALVRLNPENWKEVLPGYNLGWAERHRAVCHAHLSAVANVARGWNDKAVNATVRERVARFYGVRPFCPDGGTYTLSADGRRCTCNVHGDPQEPRQLAAPSPDSPTGQVLKTFAGLRATLTFHEDGLRAVVVVERKE